MRFSRKLLVAGGAVLLLAALGAYLPWTRDGGSPPDSLRGEASSGNPAPALVPRRPLFDFGNPYLDGRSSWLAARFEVDRLEFRSLATPQEDSVGSEVHTEPFTAGSWVAKLDEVLSRQRVDAETRAVESRVVFHVPEVPPARLALFLACSGFVEQVGAEGEYDRENFFPPLSPPVEALDAVPELKANQFLTRERWRGTLGSQPTDVYFINELQAHDGDCALVYEVWSNCGDDEHARIHLSSGQYAVRGAGGGSIVFLHSFYRGQDFPSLLRHFVAQTTTAYYRKVSKHIRRFSGSWVPDARVRAWAEAFSWNWE